MADLRKFQDCRFFLIGTCANPACPFLHDEAKKQAFQAARSQDCWFFLEGPQGCTKGAACAFLHDEGKKAALDAKKRISTEAMLSRPLEAPSRVSADDNLLVDLDSPTTARVLPPSSRGAGGGRFPSPSAAPLRQPQSHFKATQQRPAASRLAQPAAFAEPERISHGRINRGQPAAELDRPQPGPRDWGPVRPGWDPARRVPAAEARRPAQALQYDDRMEQEEEEEEDWDDRAPQAVVAAAPKPRKRSVFDRLGGADPPRPKRLSVHDDEEKEGQSRRRSHSQGAADDATGSHAAKRSRLDRPPVSGSAKAREVQLVEPSVVDRLGAASGSRTARPSTSSTLDRALEPASRPTVRSTITSRTSSSPKQAAVQPRSKSLADAPKLGGSGRSAALSAVFAPPKSREELKKERGEGVESAQPARSSKPAAAAIASNTAALQPSQTSSQGRKHAPIPAPGQASTAPAKHEPISFTALSAKPTAPAPSKPIQQPQAAVQLQPRNHVASSATAAAAKPAATGQATASKASGKPADNLATNSAEFKWNTDGLEDEGEDEFDDLELDAEPATNGNTTDFDKELEEFESAFD